jgi:putative methyltransferase (TIGR04325 family)
MSLRRLIERGLSTGSIASATRALPVLERLYWTFFCSKRGGNNFQFGYYPSLTQAAAVIPFRFRSGWNNDASAQHYIDMFSQPSAYAVLFWLSRLLRENTCVLDLGGGVGQTYHAYLRRTPLPNNVSWYVVDVAAAVELGRRRAIIDRSHGLSFETDIAQVPGPDILVSSGAIQFMGDPLPGVLDALAALPGWIIINKLVLTQRPTYWTLHNIGTGMTTYQIFNETQFLRYFTDRGYVIRDRWAVPEISMEIPFHPEGFVPTATGLCFERTSSASNPQHYPAQQL